MDSFKEHHVQSGKAFIFSPKKFETDVGIKKDINELERALTNFKFEVVAEKYNTKTEIEDRLKAVSKEDHDQIDAILVAVLSHKTENADWYGSDFDPQEILCKPFTQDHSGRKKLAGKPKIFLFSACKGKVNLIFKSKSKLRQNCSPVSTWRSSRCGQSHRGPEARQDTDRV